MSTQRTTATAVSLARKGSKKKPPTASEKPPKRKLSNLNYVTKEQAGFTAMIIGL